MLRIGLTGGIACGKSLVGAFLKADGVAVCDSDAIARDVMRKGTAVHFSIVESFGRDILDATGEINRAVLGGRVFGVAQALSELNRLVHPEVMHRLDIWFDQHARECGVAVAEVPLLFEVAGGWHWDRVVCVGAPRRRTLEWLTGRGLSESDSEKRIGSQMPLSLKMARADHVIFNSGTKDMLRDQARLAWSRIVKVEKARNG